MSRDEMLEALSHLTPKHSLDCSGLRARAWKGSNQPVPDDECSCGCALRMGAWKKIETAIVAGSRDVSHQVAVLCRCGKRHKVTQESTGVLVVNPCPACIRKDGK